MSGEPGSGPEPAEGAGQVVRRRRPIAGAAPSPTRWRSAAVTGAVGTVAAIAWILSGPAVDVATTDAPAASSATPLASVRRAPDWLTATIADRTLRGRVDPVEEQFPDLACASLRDGGRTVAELDETSLVVPASNLKPLTAVAAVELLGADTRAVTEVVAGGPVADGVVRGDLVLVGGGDPVLSTAGYEPYEGVPRTLLTPMEELADRVVAAGVREVSGSIVGDESRYDAVRTAPGWRPSYLEDAQVAPLSALVVDDGAPDPAAVDPARQAATVLRDLLSARGVRVVGGVGTGVAPPGATELARVESPTVTELAEELVRFSDNTTAELLVKEIGLQRSGAGTTAAGTAAVLEWARAAGIPVDGAVVVDGSGLSRDNRLSCAAMVSVIERGGPDGALAGWLARPGRPGTLDDRMVGGDLADRVRAKTGSLDGVRTLSGWVETSPGRPLAFAVGAQSDGGLSSGQLESLEERLLAAALGYPATPDPAALRPRSGATP